MKNKSFFLLSLVLLVGFFVVILSCGGSDPATDTTDDDDDAPTTEDTSGEPYDMGDPTFTELYVSPSGSDSNSGTSIDEPLESLPAAWALIPTTLTTTGYRINMLPGDYPCGDDELHDCQNYFSDREGTYDAPIMIRSVDAEGEYEAGTATVRGGMDVNDVSYLYVLGVDMIAGREEDGLPMNNSGNNIFHVANSDHILLRDATLTGPTGLTDTTSNVQEVVKANTSEAIYLENNDLSHSHQTVVDYFSTNGGHVINNHIHESG
ncbi:MAG TPA: hypothetical protein VJC18_06830, partial [bacterium]|nr:hypothetical protein [bacterium]